MRTFEVEVGALITIQEGDSFVVTAETEEEAIRIAKSKLEESDSFLAQGGICMLRDEDDYDGYFEDTLRAGHYENDVISVELMIRGSKDVINDLISYGVDFKRNEDGSLAFTREGAHGRPRILYHEDITGQEITSKLLSEVKRRDNIEMWEYACMTDLIVEDNCCKGAVVRYNNKI